MARLEEILKQSPLGAAYCDTPDNHRVIVTPKPKTRAPSETIRYFVRVEHGSIPPTDAYDAPDLETAVALMRTLDLDGFDPLTAEWQSVDTHTRDESTMWSDEVATHGLQPASDSGSEATGNP